MDIDALNKMFLLLRMNGVYATKQFKKDISNLVKVDSDKFIEVFTGDMLRSNLKEYNRHKQLRLSNEQKRRIDGNSLFRYEYRNRSNLRCIYLLKEENTTNETILLNAFNEDGDKKKGKNSYKNNIERAIKIYNEIKLKGDF